MSNFGVTIKNLRREKKITQRSLAEKVGVDFTYISKIENERLENYPSTESIIKIARALGADADELILLAKKVPDTIRETIVDNELAAVFLRKFPQMSPDKRKKIKEIINEG